MESFARWRVERDVEALVVGHTAAAAVLLAHPHAHRELEVHFVARGEAAFLWGGERRRAPAGTIAFVPPGAAHMTLEHSGDVLHYTLLSRRRQVRRVLPAAVGRRLLDGTVPLQRQLRAGAVAPLERCFRETADAVGKQPAPLFNALAAHTLARAYIAFEAGEDAPDMARLHPAVARAVDLLGGARDPGDLRTVAKRSGASSAHLSRLFSEQLGISMTEFRNRCRLRRFFALYEPEASLMTTALDAGFGSYPQFHRVFTALVGRSPAAFRKGLR